MIFKNISPGIKLYDDSHGEIKAKYKVEQTFQAYFIGRKTESNLEFQIYSDPDNINFIRELNFTLNLDYNHDRYSE